MGSKQKNVSSLAAEPASSELQPDDTRDVPASDYSDYCGFPLSKDEDVAYNAFWEAVPHDAGDRVGAVDAATFFRSSKIGKKELKKIWDLSDSDEPLGCLSKAEFFVACKLISLHQNDEAVQLDNLSTPSPLPVFGDKAGGTPDTSRAAPRAVYQNVVLAANATTAPAPTHKTPRERPVYQNMVPAHPTAGAAATGTLPSASAGGTVPGIVVEVHDGNTDDPFGGIERTSTMSSVGARSRLDSVKGATQRRRLPSRRTSPSKKLHTKVMFNKLILSAAEEYHYNALWGQVKANKDLDGVVTATEAAAFLQTSALDRKVLKQVWEISDSADPRGSQCKEEFFVGLKLIALQQSGHALLVDNLELPTALPKVGVPVAIPTELVETPDDSASHGTRAVPPKKKPAGAMALPGMGGGGLGGLFGSGGVPTLPSRAKKIIKGPPPQIAPKGVTKATIMPTPPAGKKAPPPVIAKKKKPVGSGVPVATPSESNATTSAGVVATQMAAVAAAHDVGVSAIAKRLNLTNSDVDVYEGLWDEADTNSGFLAAGAAVKFLGTSGLPQDDLQLIWSLADTDAPKGQLDKDEFFVACKLVAIAQNGIKVNESNVTVRTALPKLGAGPSKQESNLFLPAIATKLGLSAADVVVYNKLWDSAETNGGYLAAGAAVVFLETSDLDQSVLRAIWPLADTDAPKGQLDKDEFFVACKLVAMAQNGVRLDKDLLGTATPLPKLGPVDAAAPSASPAAATLPHIARKLALSSTDVEAYNSLWAEAGTKEGYLSAIAAVGFLGTSELDQQHLKTIWDLCDTNAPKGQLDKDEFFTACKYVAVAQQGKALVEGELSKPTPLPQIGSGTLSLLACKLALSAADMVAYEQLWTVADTNDGYLAAGAAVKFLGTSGLEHSDLKEIWSLADAEAPKGRLSRTEFFTACKLVALVQQNFEANLQNLKRKCKLPKLG